VKIKGRDQHLSPRPPAARRSGLVPVYQEPSLIPDLWMSPTTCACGDTPIEPFRHWVAELGLPTLRSR
jgi:ribose transport system ATP-binding protein